VQERHTRPVQGHTRWRRFAVITIPAVVATGGIVVGMANGAIAASFAVSKGPFKVGALTLEGDDFVQYGSLVAEKDGTNHPVAVAGIGKATITNMCQSVLVPLPTGGKVSVLLRAGNKGRPAVATNLMFDMDSMKGDATFWDLNIGKDASLVGSAGAPKGRAGGFGQDATKVKLVNVQQVARSASAGTFTLPDLDLKISLAAEECFPG
jgi:hypothetical protein